MFKTALDHNILSHTCKLANIVPIPKPNKDTGNGTSYGSISLFSVIAKTREKSFLPYITSNIPTTPTKHGYKTQHSTVTALHTLNNTVAKGLNQMAPLERTTTVALDMSKPFNTINIHTKIRKPIQTNIAGTIIKCIANYVKRRIAYTTCRNHTSIKRQFKTDVLQDGVLSPILLHIYTSDLQQPRAISHGNAPKGACPYIRYKIHIEHTHAHYLSTSTQSTTNDKNTQRHRMG